MSISSDIPSPTTSATNGATSATTSTNTSAITSTTASTTVSTTVSTVLPDDLNELLAEQEQNLDDIQPATNDQLARRIIEAVLMVADEPLSTAALGAVISRSPASAEKICEEIAADCEVSDRGYVLARVAGGYRFQTNPELATYVEHFLLRGQSGRLSAAALETLAVVAYKQPISKSQVAAIRGVNVDGVIRTLEQRGLVAEVSRAPGPGRPALYGTTQLFLERMGVDSLEELAPLGQFTPDRETIQALEASLFAASS